MIGHVGHKVSALIDGQLSATETERLWSHVHTCVACRELVEREGWVKTRLAGLALCGTQPAAPNYLQSVLCAPREAVDSDEAGFADHGAERRRAVVTAALGAGSVGAALCGVLVLMVPAQAPVVDRRGPVTSLTNPTSTPRPTPARTGGATIPVTAPVNSAVSVSGPGVVGGSLGRQTARLSLPLAK